MTHRHAHDQEQLYDSAHCSFLQDYNHANCCSVTVCPWTSQPVPLNPRQGARGTHSQVAAWCKHSTPDAAAAQVAQVCLCCKVQTMLFLSQCCQCMRPQRMVGPPLPLALIPLGSWARLQPPHLVLELQMFVCLLAGLPHEQRAYCLLVVPHDVAGVGPLPPHC